MKPQDSIPSPSYQPDQSAIHSQERDRFELLSAYIDGEVTASERHQVQQWLDHDPKTQQLYQRLLHLRQGFQSLPVTLPTTAPEDLVESVLARIEKHQQRRQLLWWGSGAIAAIAIGAVSLFSGSNQNPVWQLAHSSLFQPKPQPLMIAVNRPLIEIPKAPVSNPSPEK